MCAISKGVTRDSLDFLIMNELTEDASHHQYDNCCIYFAIDANEQTVGPICLFVDE